MGSDDDEPINGYANGKPVSTRERGRSTRRGRGGGRIQSSSRSGSVRHRPYRTRSQSNDTLESLNWDDFRDRADERQRSDSYINRLGSGSSIVERQRQADLRGDPPPQAIQVTAQVHQQVPLADNQGFVSIPPPPPPPVPQPIVPQPAMS